MLARMAIEKQERPWVALAFGWFFLLMAGYQILRPIRESFVSDLPSEEKPTLFAVVFFVMLAAVPLFGWVSSVVPRRWLAHVVFHFFVVQLAAFACWVFLGPDEHAIWQARVFFVWLTVFILFATSVFWSVMADLFSKEKGERLFGPIAAGATLGGIVGSAFATSLAAALGLAWMLAIAAVLLELGLVLASALQRTIKKRTIKNSNLDENEAVRSDLPSTKQSGVLAGISDVIRSPYLRLIACYIALISFCGTMVYMQLTDTAREAIPNRDERTAFFASLNLHTQIGTLVVQFLLIGPMMKRLGLGVVLSVLPIVYAICFVLLGFSSSLLALGLVDVLTRIGAYGVTVPAREVLFTVVKPSEKYKAKNVIDTVVLRGSDAAASRLYAGIGQAAVGTGIVPWLMLPVTAAWVLVAWRLGRGQRQQATIETVEN